MKPRSIGVLCAVAVLAGAASVASAQQTRPTQAQKAPSAEAKAEKKPNIVVFKLPGTPKPTQKRERPKGVPRFRPLPNAEKLNVVKGVIPQVSGLGTSVYRARTFCLPEIIQEYLIAQYLPALPAQIVASENCTVGADNPQHVEIQFAAQASYAYLVDFFVVVLPAAPGQVDSGLRDFEVQVSGMRPFYPTATAGYNHLLPAFCVPVTGEYTVLLELKPRGDNPPYPNWGPWWFVDAEVTQFQVPGGCPPSS